MKRFTGSSICGPDSQAISDPASQPSSKVGAWVAIVVGGFLGILIMGFVIVRLFRGRQPRKMGWIDDRDELIMNCSERLHVLTDIVIANHLLRQSTSCKVLITVSIMYAANLGTYDYNTIIISAYHVLPCACLQYEEYIYIEIWYSFHFGTHFNVLVTFIVRGPNYSGST